MSYLSLHLYELTLLTIVIKLVCLLVTIAYFTLAERKIMAAVQRRHGPDVVGFWGLLQPLADGLKLFAKELVIPTSSNSRLFVGAPMAVLALAFLSWAVIPFHLFDHLDCAQVKTTSRVLAATAGEPDNIWWRLLLYILGVTDHLTAEELEKLCTALYIFTALEAKVNNFVRELIVDLQPYLSLLMDFYEFLGREWCCRNGVLPAKIIKFIFVQKGEVYFFSVYGWCVLVWAPLQALAWLYLFFRR